MGGGIQTKSVAYTDGIEIVETERYAALSLVAMDQGRKPLLFFAAEGRGFNGELASTPHRHKQPDCSRDQRRRRQTPKKKRFKFKARPQQHKLTVARDQEIEHLCCRCRLRSSAHAPAVEGRVQVAPRNHRSTGFGRPDNATRWIVSARGPRAPDLSIFHPAARRAKTPVEASAKSRTPIASQRIYFTPPPALPISRPALELRLVTDDPTMIARRPASSPRRRARSA